MGGAFRPGAAALFGPIKLGLSVPVVRRCGGR
jgi:hypothetical protein